PLTVVSEQAERENNSIKTTIIETNLFIISPPWVNYSIKAAEPQYFFTIHYYFLPPKNPECIFSEE
ncbi:MAG: hypothetical protein IJP35_05805, partial [Clostridia bacterium]|nr:hypothetical protein [Clostridia bacterium]